MSLDTPPPPPPFGAAAYPAAPPAAPETSGAAIASLVLGVVSLICSCFTALPGLICGFVGLANISKSNGLLKGKGLAILGILLSLALPVVTASVSYLGMRPFWDGGISLYRNSQSGKKVHAALTAYTAANEGTLPDTFQQLLDSGYLNAADLHADPLFWSLPAPGRNLSELAPSEVIATYGPVVFGPEKFEVRVKADGEVSVVQQSDGTETILP